MLCADIIFSSVNDACLPQNTTLESRVGLKKKAYRQYCFSKNLQFLTSEVYFYLIDFAIQMIIQDNGLCLHLGVW